MKTIPALLEVVPTDHLRLAESGDDLRLRSPVLSLEADGVPLVYAPAWGGPKRRQEAENALKLFKVLIEKAGQADDAPAHDDLELEKLKAELARVEGERDGLKAGVDDLKEELAAVELHADHADSYAAALDEILSADVTSAKKAKEVAARVRG